MELTKFISQQSVTQVLRSSQKNIQDINLEQSGNNSPLIQNVNRKTHRNTLILQKNKNNQQSITCKPISCSKFADNMFIIGPESVSSRKNQDTKIQPKIQNNNDEIITKKIKFGSEKAIGNVLPVHNPIFRPGKRVNVSSVYSPVQKKMRFYSVNENYTVVTKNQSKVQQKNQDTNVQKDLVYTTQSNSFKNRVISRKLTSYKLNNNSFKISSDKMELIEQAKIAHNRHYLNIIGLAPHHENIKIFSKLKTQEYATQAEKLQGFQDNHLLHQERGKTVPYNSYRYIKNFKKLNNADKKCNNQERSLNKVRLSEKKILPIKEDSFFLGKIRVNISNEEILRLRIMYYKDLIWKIQYNQGLRISSKEVPRYYIGRGNNSRLIRKLMGRRWWWIIQNKQDNAHFIWTQLKIYSLYQTQQSGVSLTQNDQNKSQQNWLDEHLQIKDKSALVLTKQKYSKWRQYLNINYKKQLINHDDFSLRKQLEAELNVQNTLPRKITNHLQFSRIIGNKKALYRTMMIYFNYIKKKSNQKQQQKNHQNQEQNGQTTNIKQNKKIDDINNNHANSSCYSSYLPLTFHITTGLQDNEYLQFLNIYYKLGKNQGKTNWIVKPGEMSNRGSGITFCRNLDQIKPIIKQKQFHSNGSLKTYLIQMYIDRPLLYCGRKFDIRHYIMLTSVQGIIRGYYYQQGYIRTTSYKYKLNSSSANVHLTNDAVQKNAKDYGKFQRGNKISYESFEKYLEKCAKINPSGYKFKSHILPQIRNICIDIIRASWYFMDPKRRVNNFEIFGLDIMIDQNFKCWLIQCNTNPCLENQSSSVLNNLIPDMLDNALSLTIDTLYPPPMSSQLLNTAINRKCTLPNNYILQNKFQLVFDESVDGNKIQQVYNLGNFIKEIQNYGDDDEAYQSNDEDQNKY